MLCVKAVANWAFINISIVTPEQTQGLMGMMAKFQAYAPDFNGLKPLEESIPIIRSTWEKLSIEDGHGGAFLSHFGNKQWL